MSEKVKSRKLKVKSDELMIQFVGKKSDPPAKIINGARVIELPEAEIQRKGFSHPDTAFLLKHYRKFYKQKVKKGKKR